jgi:1,2-phenylacetyl-CoA epoxidase PaaB subunit
MTEPAFYYLSEVEEMFRLSRDSLTRWAKAGIFVLQGENKGRRVTGASARAAYARLEAGEDLWLVVKQHESSAPSEPKPMARVRSIKTKEAPGGMARQPIKDSDSDLFEPLVSKQPEWLKRII